MKNTRLSLVALALIGLAMAAEDDDTCGLYLAVSSTSTADTTNWGIFAGRDYGPGEPIGSPEVSISIPHLRANVGGPERASIEPIVDFFERFFWVAETSGSQFDIMAGKSVSAIPGAGVLAGYLPERTNADWNVTMPYMRPADADASNAHPNRGGYSPYHNVQVMSTEKIVTGGEIFMEFGDSWSEDNEEKREQRLSVDDFKHIDATVTQMMEFFEKHKESLNDESKQEIYGFLKNDVMKAAVGTSKAKEVQELLPPNPDDLHKIPDAGGALPYSNPTVFRTKDWLDTYGLCVDHIRSGQSTIPNAGRGAFANRRIAKGGFIAPVPLTHITNKQVMDLHVIQENKDGDFERASDTVTGQQQFLNYCLGHPDSSMIFFPSSPVVPFVNHADKKPNAKLAWSNHASHQKMWLSMSPEELLKEENMYLGLLMELVALRDIEPGEEILIDYGKEWKQAFAKHTESWNAGLADGSIPSKWPLRAADMNEMYRDQPFSTDMSTYPENVQLKAFLQLSESTAAGTVEDPRFWVDAESETAYVHENLFDVNVLSYDKDEHMYTLQWFRGPTNSAVVTKVPHSALVFVDKPGTSDHFVQAGFRHHIGIPDDIFPQAWRNSPS